MTDEKLAKRLAELSDAFQDMCMGRDCSGCEMEAFSVEGVCAHAWIWTRLRAETCGTLDWCPAAQKKEEAAQVRSYSNEEAGTAKQVDFKHLGFDGPSRFLREGGENGQDINVPTTLPAWCKEGQWVERDGDLAKIVGVYGNFIYILDADTGRHFYRLYHYVKPVRFRPYTYDEAKGLLGKVMEYTFSTGSGYASNAILISRVSCRDDGESFIHSCPFDDWVSYKATIDGMPIGVPEIDEEALKGGEE